MKIATPRGLYLLAIFIILLCPFYTKAQITKGNPAFATMGGGPFDSINLADLNVSLGVPVFSRAGRGIPVHYSMVVNNSIWTPVASGSTQVWTPDPNWGWGSQVEVATGLLSYSSTNQRCYIGGQFVFVPLYSNIVYTDPSGWRHGFPTGTVGGCNDSGNFPATATDGSGYTLQSLGSVSTPSGQIISPPVNTPTGSGTVTDSNGNQISATSTTLTDTLGSTMLTISGGAPAPLVMQYTSPQGKAVNVSLYYQKYAVETKFNCTGISEFAPTYVYLVTDVGYPDGSGFVINYEQTPNSPGAVTGRVASIRLLTGGTVTYSYSGGSNGINCADGSTPTLTRSTPDGTWTYAHTQSGAAGTTTITDPQNNQTVLNFQGIYETERQIYQRSSSSGTLLKTIITCYNSNTTNCNSTAVNLPITQRTVTLQWPGGEQAQTKTVYNIYGIVTETDEYDYGNGAPGALTRQTLISYANLGSYIFDRPASITVKDGLGTTKAQTTYSYDQGSVTPTSGTPQHFSVSGPRGNPTTVSSLVQASTTLSKSFSYYDTGTVLAAIDVNGAQTTFTYGTGSCGNSFVTSVALPLGLTTSQTWDCTGGVTTSTTDENNQTTTFTYNDASFWRVNSKKDTAGNVTNLTYTPAIASTPASVESALTFNNSSMDILTTFDGLGRRHILQRRQSPSSTSFDSVESDFDALGRPSRVTNPYSGTAGQTNASVPSVVSTYDALDGPVQITDAGGGTVSLGYTENDVYGTLGPAPTGENTKRRQVEYDGLGRLTSVCEVTSGTGSGTCAQTNTATGFWTKYAYDVLGDLIGVTQNAQSANTQSRTYSYDGLGRMTQEFNPESGTTTYTYDSDSTCASTSNGDLVKKVDAAQNVICYTYDALHRQASAFVSSGPYLSTTPNKYLVYDSATVNGFVMSNAKGRMAEAYTATCSSCAKITDTGISYTPMGGVSDVYESTPHSGGYYHMTASYWPNGALNQLGNLLGLPTITYNLDGEGHIYSANASSGQNPLLSTTYNVAGLPAQVNLGSSDSDTFTYDPNTNRMTQYKFNVNGQSEIGNLGWNAIGTLGSLGITDPFNSADTQNCSYAHDDLARIASASCGTPWAQTFGYDAFGNVTKNGSSSFLPTYSYVTNRMTEIGSSTPTYDANGNVTNDFLHTYAWDANGRPVTIDGIAMTYDALGRMVEENRSGSYSQIVYSPTGQKLAFMNGQSLVKAYVPLPAGDGATYSSAGLQNYHHADWLGSFRLESSTGRGVFSDTAYAPFGEPYAVFGADVASFTGMTQDTDSNLYDFPAREYGIQGRWPSPDPAGLGAVDFGDPQSFNRYAYVSNRPLVSVDPLGLQKCLNVGSGGCHDGGGGGGGLGTSGGCAVNGVILTCDLPITVLLSNGVALICPSNNCGQVRMGANGNWQIMHPAYPGMDGYPCKAGICAEASYQPYVWANVTWIYMAQQTQVAGQLSQAPTVQQYLQEISRELAPLNKLDDCAATAAVHQIPFGAKIVGAPEGGSDPVGSTLSAAEKLTDNKASATVVLALNKVDLPVLSQLMENVATRIVPKVAPLASKITAAGWAWSGYSAAKETYTCYNHP